jgi:hypothetical protein
MKMADYPQPRYVSTFYAESVSLVEFLAAEKGPQELPKFIRDAAKQGFERALQDHYQLKSFDELQKKWEARAFAGNGDVKSSGVVRANKP